MEQATAKVISELTCWKCGEESLHEPPAAAAPRGAHGELPASTMSRHSVCQKCGTYSVNAAQTLHNKTVDRKARKAHIYESNRASK